MPIYYNTSAPTPSTKNNINDIAVSYGIRDFLLNRNLLPFYPQISTSINGSQRIGEPVLDTSINDNSNVIPFGLPLETEGLIRYEIAVLPNQFKNSNQTAPSLINIEDIPIIQGLFGDITLPVGVDSYPTSSSQEVEEYGILGKTEYAELRKNATITNLYLDSSSQVDAADWISLQPAGFSQQIGGYLDEYGGLNLGGSPSIQASNVIGSILNGQGLGLAKGGVVTNFDFRSSLAGRVLGASGIVNDTKLGLIGGQQLALSLANNAAFNLQEDILGGLNVQDNILSLIKDGTLAGFRPNYKITVPSGTGGRVADYTSRLLGFTLPKSYLEDAGSIFLSESDSPNIERANSMILNTGKGQVAALITNVFANINGTSQYDSPDISRFRSGYVPGYKNNQGQKAIESNIYAFGDEDGNVYNFITNGTSLIPEISYNRTNMLEAYGFKGFNTEETGLKGDSYVGNNIKSPTFTWGSNQDNNVNTFPEFNPVIFPKKTLLGKTQQLFNSNGMLNIVSTKGDMNKTSNQIQTSNGGGFSKGSAVIKGDRYTQDGFFDGKKDSAENTYCRSWTTNDRYDQVSKMIRSSGLNKTVPYRFQSNNSTLDEFGFVKVAPYKTDKLYDENNYVGVDPKKYMFSIENLAWSDNWADLPPVEKGMGDLLSGKKGRIMWFPPYNISFNEASNVSWEKNDFIGRGESVYTYNNTERTGNLSFSIVVDHPSYINAFRNPNGPDDNYVASFFAGCVDPNSYFADKLTVSEKSSIAQTQTIIQQTAVLTPEVPPNKFSIYFPNDNVDVGDLLSLGYENGLSASTQIDYTTNPQGTGAGIGSYVGGVTSQTAWNDINNFGLNGWKQPIEIDGVSYSGFSDPAYGPALSTYLDNKCKFCIVKISAYASAQGNASANTTLANGRSASVKDYLLNTLGIFNGKSDSEISKRFPKPTTKTLTGTGCVVGSGQQTDSIDCKQDRRAEVTFEYSNELAAEETIQPQPIVQNNTQQINTKITNRLYNESAYFEQLTNTDKFVFDSFREKIKYFHPSFHSTTPEGLNSRLTFLQQCTRQGPTLEAQGADNLAFGRPPVCILRLGDFYNTKIIIDNINIEYEPLVWDLNPEGSGVQPMIANVNMSFKFIGGSTLMGPINKLQNALSFNYYANAHVYDPRADYIAKVSNQTPIETQTLGTTQGTNLATSEHNSNKPYTIVNGFKDLAKYNDRFLIKETSSTDIPEVNQELASDQTNSGDNVPVMSADEISDTNKDINVNILLDYVRDITNKTAKGNAFINVAVVDGYSKDYDVKFIIFDAIGYPHNLGVGKILTGAQETNFNFSFDYNDDNFNFSDNADFKYQIKMSYLNLDNKAITKDIII